MRCSLYLHSKAASTRQPNFPRSSFWCSACQSNQRTLQVTAAFYCQPEIASNGKTESQAREAGLDISVGKFPFVASGKSGGSGHTEGYIKGITNKARGEIVGVHAIGEGVTDLIAEMSLAMTSEATAHDILAAVHPHPTLYESILEATAAALGDVIHI